MQTFNFSNHLKLLKIKPLINLYIRYEIFMLSVKKDRCNLVGHILNIFPGMVYCFSVHLKYWYKMILY